MKNILAAFLAVIVFVACSSATPLPGGTPDYSDATSIPFSTKTATTTPTTEPSFFESGTFGYRLQIPAGYRIEVLPSQKGILFALGLVPEENDQTQQFGFPIGLIVYEKTPAVPLLDWFSSHIGDLTESGQPTSDEAFFYAPTIYNQNDFKEEPALQYLSGSRPVPFGTLVDRGAWVIGFYYLRDYPVDYQLLYEQMLTTLEFFSPTGTPISATPLPPTVTPTACLDEFAQPRTLPPRQTPLEVLFVSDGNIWIWEEENGIAQQVSNTGDAQTFSFSPNRELVAFTRGPLYQQTELWGIHRDGTNLRLLISTEQLQKMAGEPSTTEHPYLDEINYVDWITGTSRLGFVIQRNYQAIGGCCEFGGYWQVDVETGDLSAWTPPQESVKVQEGLLSPDGSQIAVINDESITLMNADGSNVRENIFSFTSSPFPEGGGVISPYIWWVQDSSSLAAITFVGDVYSSESLITIWRIPVDGSTAQEMHTFSTLFFWVTLAPNQEYIAYKKMIRPGVNDYELHLATTDGSKDIIYQTQYGLEFLHWHPDSYQFVYEQSGIFRPFLGSVCSDSIPLLESTDIPATNIQWIDAQRFIYTKGSPDPIAGPRELRLGQIGGPSILIGPFNGETAYYLFNVEKTPLGQKEN